MRKLFEQCRKGTFEKKYILPFFWQHGEEKEVLVKEMDVILESNIREFCVESRVYEKFCEEEWWVDFGFLLEEAKKRDMRVWLLDDKHFPTGYANNYIEKHPELRKLSLRVEYRDFLGPAQDCALIPPPLQEGEDYFTITAFERKENGNILYGKPINLMPALKDGLVTFHIPDGMWRVYYVIKTHQSIKSKMNYIDMLSKESCMAQIYAVYEPHYEHFASYFGNTFAGFFSDEPGFNNDGGCYDSKLGKEGMLIPWNDKIPELLTQKSELSEEEILLYLPSLWHDTEKTSEIRQLYMDLISELYQENFSYLLGDWCREHNVQYIGHIIEDMNTHMRLGHGPAHYFRALNGQDMGGIDVVLHQVVPGMQNLNHTASVFQNMVDADFYHYALGKLASSHAHIQPLKQNRAMCEIFGAYGWAEGLPLQKKLADHMLVRGINYFVPHAFNPKYPDFDCPPFFYAEGRNLQYKLFGKLMSYLQRCCYLLENGDPVITVAVFYNAEAEWSGGRYELFQNTAKQLMQNQIDFDFLPEDSLYEASGREQKLCVANRTYHALIVPYSELLPYKLIETFDLLMKEGVTVLFSDAKPSNSSEHRTIEGLLEGAKIVSADKIAAYLKQHKIYDVMTTTEEKDLRIFHNRYEKGDIYMLVNEAAKKDIDTELLLPDGTYCFYDAWENRIYATEQKKQGVRIKIAAGASVFLLQGYHAAEKIEKWNDVLPIETQKLTYTIYLKDVMDQEYTFYDKTMCLYNISEKKRDFYGKILYMTEFMAEADQSISKLSLGRVGETAEVWLNEEYCGAVIGEPYIFDIKKYVKRGKNELRIEVINNQGYRERDVFSTYLQLPPSGLIGPVRFG